uniref:Ribosomal protein L6 n=1 Tax=Berkeleya fennica TaxID=1577906 RepID=A0A0U1XYE0_BERFE|nr:ribosomal protein L6 [Berkeleya fennica]AJA05806.1 ribosomal protein L6 [Berkeleya fennica]
MKNIPKKYTIKIPNDTIILCCNKKKIITVVGSLTKKSLKLKVKVFFENETNTIKVSSIPFSTLSSNERKKIKSIQGTTVSLIKQLIIETSAILHTKLKFVGVGYRAFHVENFAERLLLFKLGYSHPIYFKITEDLKIFSLKFTKLFIYGNSYQSITQTASLIRSYKKPEPYKGKGILYDNEKITLKEGKKV